MSAGRFGRALGSSMGARIVVGVVNYGLFWVLAHRLDPRGLGGFSLLTNTFFAIQMLPLLGLSVPLVRRAATGPDRLAHETTAAFVFAAPVALVLVALVGVLGQREHPELALPFWLVAATVVPSTWICIAEMVLIGRERFGDLSRITLLETAARSALALVALRYGGGLAGVVSAFLAGRLLSAVLYLRDAGVPLPRPSLFSAALQRRNWREVPVFFVIFVVAVLVTRLDVIVLASLGGLGEAGVYAAAARLYEAVQMLPTVLALVVMPLLARQFVAARARFGATLAVAIRLVLTLGLGVALPVSIAADAIVQTLYGPAMADSAGVLRWLVFGAVLTVADVILSATMLAASAQRDDLRALLANLAVLTLGLVALVPRFGPEGAAAAVVGGLGVRLGLRFVWGGRTLALPSMTVPVLRLAGATGLGLAAARWSAPAGLPAAAATAVVVYGAAVLATGGFGRHPVAQFRTDLATLTRTPPDAASA